MFYADDAKVNNIDYVIKYIYKHINLKLLCGVKIIFFEICIVFFF